MTASERDALWRERMTPGLGPTEAWTLFCTTVEGGSLLARDPRNGPKPLRVGFDLNDDADHILYKCSDDAHGRANKGTRRPEDFCQTRADRIGWLPEALLNPDAIYVHFANASKFLYVTRTLSGEEFIVIVSESRNPRGSGWFVTFYEARSSDWARERTNYKKTYPVKGGGPKFQKRKGR